MSSPTFSQRLLVCGRMLWIIQNHCIHFPAHLTCMMIMQLVRYFRPKIYWVTESYLYRWILALVSAWGWTIGHRVIEYGEDVYQCCFSECIVVVNHQTTADVPLLMGILQNKDRVVNRIMWIMDRIFKYTHFGLVANMHGDYFIQQGKSVRDQELQMLKNHIGDVYYPLNRQWTMLFPEGGFLYKRRARSQKYARDNNLKVLNHVTHPRIGALKAIMDAMEPKTPAKPRESEEERRFSTKEDTPGVKYIVDITIGYADQDPLDFISLALGTKPAKKVHVYYRYYPIHAVPKDVPGLTEWLYARYEEKELLLDELYKTGRYPKLELGYHSNHHLSRPREIAFNPWWFVVLHTFFIIFAYIFYCIGRQTYRFMCGV